ncbi:MAG: Glycosyl transferase group 1, partial [Candidatus Woesebacteria bacterium GW2011_GWA1_41_7]
KRDAIVIYPPVEIPKVDLKNKESRDYYLVGGRLARAKRTDLVIEVCNKLKLPLKIFGRGFGGYEEYLKSMIGPTVEFLGEVTEDVKWNLYRNAKAFLYPTEMEDFGIQAVEAMAAGTPVIALAQGGPLETIVEGKTGLFFNELTPESLADAVRKFEKMKFNSQDCITQAKKFSKSRFKREIAEYITKHA